MDDASKDFLISPFYYQKREHFTWWLDKHKVFSHYTIKDAVMRSHPDTNFNPNLMITNYYNVSSSDPWASVFYLTSKKLLSFVFISASEIGFPFSCTHLHTKPFYLRSGKPDSWGLGRACMLPYLIPEQLNLQRMPAKLPECEVLQITSYGPRYAPDTHVIPQLTGRASCDLVHGSTRPQITPRGSCHSLHRHRADEDRSNGFVA